MGQKHSETRDQGETGTAAGSATHLYDLMRNVRRRYVLYYAEQSGGRVSIEELVETIAAWESPSGTDAVSLDRRKSVYTALHQTHLPKLEQSGLIHYDRTDRAVAVRDRATRVELYPSPRTLAWDRYFGLLSAVSALVVGLSALGVLPLGSLAGVPWTESVLCAFILVTIGYNYDRRRWRRRLRDDGPDIVIDDQRAGRPEE
jgi:hypothetical protein